MTVELVPAPEATSKIVARSSEILAAAGRCNIVSDEVFGKAGAFLLTIKDVRREIDATFDGPIAAAFAAHKSIVAAKKTHAAPVDEAERIVKGKMADYRQRQEDEARERQRVADEAARKVADEARAVAQAEARRLAEEARAAEVARLRVEGETRKANAAAKAAVFVAPVPLPPVAPAVVPYVAPAQAAGVTFREKWTATVLDFPALVRAVADGRAPLTLLDANQSALNKHAVAHQNFSPIPGVAFSCEKVVSAR